MKQIARMISVSMLLLMCSVVMMAKEANANVVVASVQNGTISATVDGQTCTLTVTPAAGYYIRKSDITVKPTVDPSKLSARAFESQDVTVPVAANLELEGDDPAVLSAARTYTFTVPDGYGAYVTATFTAATAITDEMVKFNDQTYTGEEVKPIYLKDGDNTLTEDTDYTISYENNINATGGETTAKATITGIGIYKGTLTKEFAIFPAIITSVEWGNDPKNPIVKSGNNTLTKGTDYDVTVELRKVTVTGKGNYTNGSTTFERTISAFDEIEMAACNYGVSPIAGMPSQYNYVYVWTGASFTPTVTVSYSADEDDIEFLEGTDYTVTILKLGGDEPVEVTEITGPGNYNLVVKEKVGTKQKQFIIGYEVKAYTISFAAEQMWGGYYSDCNLSLPEGVKAYVITGISDAEATAEEIGYIPAGVPVLLYRENTTAAANFTIGVYSGTATAPATNLLMVAPAGGKTVTDAQIYVLYKNEFVLASAGKLPAGRVYLPVTFSSEEEDSRLIIVIDGATAIASCPLSTATSHQDAWYSLDGRKLSGEPTRQGVYVYKGKKVKR